MLCGCPRRLAAGTVDSLLGKLRSIFNRVSVALVYQPCRKSSQVWLFLCRKWFPCSSLSFENYCRVALLREKITYSQSLSRIHKYVLVRDTVFFVVDFFTGYRASDLGHLLARQVFKFKDREGYDLPLQRLCARVLPVPSLKFPFANRRFARFKCT